MHFFTPQLFDNNILSFQEEIEGEDENYFSTKGSQEER